MTEPVRASCPWGVPGPPSGEPLKMTLAVVVPLRNEEAVLPRLMAALDELRRTTCVSLTAVLVDDASTDGTPRILSGLKTEWLTCIRCPQRVGQHRAVLEGMTEALRANHVTAVATMDADMDPPPSALAMLLPHLGPHDLVVGGRSHRKRTTTRSVASWALGRVCRTLAATPITDHGSMFRLMDRRVAARCVDLRGRGPCLSGLTLVAASNPTQVPLPFSRSPRPSRYKLGGIARVAIDISLLVIRSKRGGAPARRIPRCAV